MITALILIVTISLLVLVKATGTYGALVHQNGPVEDVALGTLAQRTALQIEGDFTGISATFLMKRVRYLVKLENITSGEGPFAVVLAGDATAAEAAAGVTEGNTSGPSDRTQMLTQDTSWNIIQDSLELLKDNGADTIQQTSGRWHTVGGKKGIPFPEGSGWQAVVVNLDNAALTTGAIMKGVIQYQGVWLRD